MLATVPAPLLEPCRELLSHIVDGLSGALERTADALAVVGGRPLALLPQRRLVADAEVLAAHDPVVVALAHPVEQLAHPLDRQRVGDLEVLEQPRQPLEAGPLLGVLHSLLDE